MPCRSDSAWLKSVSTLSGWFHFSASRPRFSITPGSSGATAVSQSACATRMSPRTSRARHRSVSSGADTSAYTPIQLYFASPIPLGSLTEEATYVPELSASVANSTQYSIKGGASALTFRDSAGAPAVINVTAEGGPD